ncbi:ABC transporter permease, partial [Paenibacillus sp. 598K]|uniref:ABC transporter permease n=1 Tax=Paenibacillus sp. 598K TaxID=1117987 RepID=UPI00162A6EA1
QLLAGRRSKTVPPYSRWLTVAALALLGAAYALAATADGASIYSRVAPVTAMAICGTYLFYTQASAALIASLKRRKPLFWRGRHMIVIAGLAHRLQDHARMFFLVTILSAVMLCSVGFFASVTTIPEELTADYPAAVAYVAKVGHDGVAELARIEAELAARGIAADRLSLPIQYVETSADRSVSRPLPLIGYRDYAAAMRLSRADIIHPPLTGTQALVMLGSQRDRTLLDVRSLHTYALPDSYTLADQPLVLQEIGYTDTVILPDHLVTNRAEPSIGEFSGLVVADELIERLRDDSARERYTGYYVADLRQTAGLAAALADHGLVRHEEAAPYALAVSGTLLEARSGLYGTMLFIALLMGGVVFLAAGSFLYFRLYAELEYDRRQYETLLRLGMTEGELRRIVTLQIGWLFFVPFGLAIVHSGFAFLALQQIFYLSVADRLIGVLAGFIAAQVLYFLFIRNRYWRHLRRAWH